MEDAQRLADDSPPWLLMALAVDVSLSLVLFLFFLFHLKLVVCNQTTIETELETLPSPSFNVGVRKNVEQVFGANAWLWWLPMWGSGPVGDGISWPRAGDSTASSADDSNGNGYIAKHNSSGAGLSMWGGENEANTRGRGMGMGNAVVENEGKGGEALQLLLEMADSQADTLAAQST
jgi:hypothetical protein